MASNSPAAVLSLLLLLQLTALLALTLGAIYLLYCLGRAAAGLDRLASVAEAWLVWQQTQSARAITIEATQPSVTSSANSSAPTSPAASPAAAPMAAPLSGEVASQ